MTRSDWTGDFRAIEARCAKVAIDLGVNPPDIRLEWNSRFTRKMGDARVVDRDLRLGRVRLSLPLWPHMTERAREETIVHEIAHVYASLEQPRAGHGEIWKRWMRRFGVTPERLYQIDAATFTNTAAVKAKRRKLKRYVGRCDGPCGRVVTMSAIQRGRALKGNYRYRCAGCGAPRTLDWVRGLEELGDA